MLDRFEEFSFIITSIYRDIQKIEREEMEKLGFKGAYAQYLLAMIRHPQGITSAQLCEICDKNKAAVSRVISELENKGLVTRENKKDNRYNALLKLTDSGQIVAEFVCEKIRIAVKEVGNDLTTEERQVLYATLKNLSQKIQKLTVHGIPKI